MSTIYLIQLKPADKFFFGQKNTFGEDNVNYFVRSAYFPQQTSLLGLLRYQLLLHADDDTFKDNKIQDRHKANALIGEKSFSPFGPNGSGFGIIRALSPLFLMNKNGDSFVPAGMKYQQTDELEPLQLSMEGGMPLLSGYSAKKGVESPWLSSNSKQLISECQLFVEDTRVGIRKNYNGGTDDDAFFRQTFYHFNTKDNDDYCFAFRVETEREWNLPERTIAYLGGERQPFVMTVRKEDEQSLLPTGDYQFDPDKTFYTVLLLSDALIGEDQTKESVFAITKVKDFACLMTNTSTTRYYNRRPERVQNPCNNQDKNVGFCLTQDMELYGAGSLFYFKDADTAQSFKDAVEQSHFHTIGYNYATIINPKNN